MTLPMSHLPNQAELSEFRNALAMAKAAHAGNQSDVQLIAQIIDDPQAHVTALRVIIEFLLTELDTAKRDSADVLRMLIENAAMQETRG